MSRGPFQKAGYVEPELKGTRSFPFVKVRWLNPEQERSLKPVSEAGVTHIQSVN